MLPPGPRLPAALQLANWIVRPLPFLDRCRARFGDVFTLDVLGFGRWVVLASPQAIREVFTGDPHVLHAGEANWILGPVVGAHSVLLLDGAPHARQRRLLLPPFHGERMHAYASVMREETEREVDAWPFGEPFRLHPRLQSITLNVILRAVFGIQDEATHARVHDDIVRLLDTFETPITFFPFLHRDLGPLTPWRTFRARLDAVDREIYAEIARARAGPPEALERRTDVAALLLRARDEEGRPMTDVELRDELMTLLAAGHETTATSLAWAFDQILAHPAALARIEAELDALTGGGERPLGPGELARLEYLDAAIKESLRRRPIFPIVVRRLATEATVAGHALRAGTIVAPCIHLAQRRPDIYPDPDAFRPERFLGVKPDPFAWLPFGGGDRRCIGMAFALYEMKVVIATVLGRARLELAGSPSRVGRRGISIAPAGGVRVVLERRLARPGAPASTAALAR